MNRRGSKSEGRINITVQDRLAETERLKKECAVKTIAAAIAPTRSVFDGICNVKVLTASDMDPNRLGRIRPLGQKPIPRPIELQSNANDTVFHTIIEPPSPNPNSVQSTNKENESQNGERSNSVDNDVAVKGDCAADIVEIKFLTDSATITLPLATQTPAAPVNPPKYKTMPSPTRTNTILPGAMCLNEIFEEGTDVGSSDTSTTTTPRPVVKHTNFTNQRSSSQQSGAHAHRRSKFNKARTASCSSSDDDDSENRKKRAHKIVDSTKPFQTQRRDSNDDSSDSQDPGNSACGGASGSNSGSATFSVQIISGESNTSESTNDDSGGHSCDGNTNGRQKSIQGFRRHRAGRRRTGETRLRESQSLNRITEVQESELPILSTIQNPNRSPATLSTSAIDQSNPQSPTTSTHSSISAAATHKPSKLGFGARLLQGFKKSDHISKSHDTILKTNEPKNKHNNNNNHKNNWNGNHIPSAESNETLNWIKSTKPPLRVKAHQRLKNLKCLVDIFS